MAAIATGLEPYGPYGVATCDLKTGVGAIKNTGDFYVTPDICRELSHIDNGVDHLRLDNNILTTSKTWADKINNGNLPIERQGASNVINSAKRVTFDLMNATNTRNTKPMLDNEKREIHHWAVQSLKGVEKELGPFVHASSDRLRQFSDHVGVTDRYTGYRHNLNRVNRDRVNMGHRWLDTNRTGSRISQNIGWKSDPSDNYNADYQPRPAARSAPAGFARTTNKQTEDVMERIHPTHIGIKHKPTVPRSIQERCGIVVAFPGRTEIMDRYKMPTETLSNAFIINPNPDFSRTGRPLMELKIKKSYSEFETRYQWPDGRLIDLKPWLRK